jgi:uncharacterized membrane protein YqgA involved in biofilm formation
MWILKFIPDWFFYAILVGGIVGLLASKYVPAYYRSAVQAVALLAFVVGVFMSGAIYDNEAWVARVKEMEAKVAEAETQSKEANTKVDAKVEQKLQKNKEKQVIVKQYITREVTKYDKTCVIPKEFVDVHNKAAEK